MDDMTQRLLDGARTAEIVDLDGGALPASALLDVLTGATAERVHPRGVRVRNARVTGDVDWDTLRLAADLGLRAVAEGVEDETTLGELERMGCRHFQGFLLGRPAPAGAVPQLARRVDLPV
ncbi:EAL domain-containing protein [Spongisporangium articulatum]|uniref:EAL domain-containing protein n=1 Tax=Spongisporangium articulatum TaxID=3362603 RepID=A0ABW8AM89_9ACTN